MCACVCPKTYIFLTTPKPIERFSIFPFNIISTTTTRPDIKVNDQNVFYRKVSGPENLRKNEKIAEKLGKKNINGNDERNRESVCVGCSFHVIILWIVNYTRRLVFFVVWYWPSVGRSEGNISETPQWKLAYAQKMYIHLYCVCPPRTRCLKLDAIFLDRRFSRHRIRSCRACVNHFFFFHHREFWLQNSFDSR